MRPSHTELPKSSITLNLRGFFYLWPYLWPKNLPGAKLRLILATLSMVLAKVAVISTPLFFKYLIDDLKVDPLTTLPFMLITAYAGSRLFSGLFNEIRDCIFAYVSERAMHQAGVSVFNHLHQLSLRFHLERKTGSLTQIIQRGVKSIEEFMQFSTFSLIPTLIEIVFVVGIFAYLYGFMISLIAALSMALYIFSTLKITEWRIKFMRDMNSHDAAASGKAIDSLINFETVKYFNNEEHEAKRYESALTSYEKSAIKSKMSLSVLNTAQNFITSSALFAILVYACMHFYSDHFTLGDFIAINAYLLQLFTPLYMVGFAYRQVRLALINMEQMFELLDVESDTKDLTDSQDLALKKGEVVFKDVSFAYQSDRPILKNISFTIPPKGTFALVGTSGGGKSTIAKLLYRFYDVGSGQILIDDQDVRLCTQQSVRKLMGVVPQDTVLFNDTIGYNIAYGKPDATEAEIIAVAKQAQIHDFVTSLPDGYQSLVGERGLKLSGGEKQRIAIARTLLKNPQIFIFDEATSALDSHTEKAIQQQLEGLAKNHTTIIIAHRLSTVTHADQILVLDQGEIAERGTHDELLKKNGLYAALWYKQATVDEAA